MKSKKILLICTISLVTVSVMLASCGKKENIKNSNDKKIESISEENDKDNDKIMTKIKKQVMLKKIKQMVKCLMGKKIK